VTTLPDVDIRKVENYIATFDHAHRRLDTLPLSTRLLREMHARLLLDVRGEEMDSGEFRRSQNWIGPPGCTLDGATFVPPRHDPEMRDAESDWERFLHDQDHQLLPSASRPQPTVGTQASRTSPRQCCGGGI